MAFSRNSAQQHSKKLNKEKEVKSYAINDQSGEFYNILIPMHMHIKCMYLRMEITVTIYNTMFQG